MQIVSNGDNLHEISDPVYWENNLSSAELAQTVVKVQETFLGKRLTQVTVTNFSFSWVKVEEVDRLPHLREVSSLKY